VLSAALGAMWGLDPRPHLPALDGEHHVVRVYREVVL
jgi:hypothetical protein